MPAETLTHSVRVGPCLAGLCVSVAIASQPSVSSTTTSASTAPATTRQAAGDNIVIYQPGVAINWTRHQVELAGKVVLRQGTLELFACAVGLDGSDKAHESIVLLSGRPRHIHQALGLIGLEPGHPPRWDTRTNQVVPATGQPLDLRVEWIYDAHRHEAAAHEWMQRGDDPNRFLGPLPWVFAGSLSRQGGGVLADEDGTVATVVDFDGSVICLSETHSSDNTQLWLAARTDRIPPINTPCTLLIRAADFTIDIDRFGRFMLWGKQFDLDTLSDRVATYLRTTPGGKVRVRVSPTTPPSDLKTLHKRLRSLGAAEGSIIEQRQPDDAFPSHDPNAVRTILHSSPAIRPSFAEPIAGDHERFVRQLTSRSSAVGSRASETAEYLNRLEANLSGQTTKPAAPTTTTAPRRE